MAEIQRQQGAHQKKTALNSFSQRDRQGKFFGAPMRL
jgi:hypothetical protein